MPSGAVDRANYPRRSSTIEHTPEDIEIGRKRGLAHARRALHGYVNRCINCDDRCEAYVCEACAFGVARKDD